MRITSDWHIHTEFSYDSACMKMADLVRLAAEKGITDYGVTDHFNTPYNLPDIVASRQGFLAVGPSARFHFGVEASCVSRWELDEAAAGRRPGGVYGIREGGLPGGDLAIGLTEHDLAALGIEYVVAGTHWPIYTPMEPQVIIADYHRQSLFLACHPLVDVVGHPWWWMGPWRTERWTYESDPWFDDFRRVPQSMHDELAAAALEHGTAVEANLGGILLSGMYGEHFRRQYLEYLARLAQCGVKLAVGSDCHGGDYNIDFAAAERMFESVGITEEHLWNLPPRRG